MSCSTCLGRKAFALQFYPRRRPLFVRCGSCKMRRNARWYVASRVVALMFGVVFSIALASGYLFKVAWELKGALGR